MLYENLTTQPGDFFDDNGRPWTVESELPIPIMPKTEQVRKFGYLAIRTIKSPDWRGYEAETMQVFV